MINIIEPDDTIEKKEGCRSSLKEQPYFSKELISCGVLRKYIYNGSLKFNLFFLSAILTMFVLLRLVDIID